MTGYIKNDTYISYETSYLAFSYDHSEKIFKLKWKSNRWNYKRAKVSYVPADRNLVAAIPGWSTLPLGDNMLEFMSNWDKARRYIKEEKIYLVLACHINTIRSLIPIKFKLKMVTL